MASPWTVAQVPAWVVWGLIMILECVIVYFGFQEGMTGSEPPRHALMLRNIGLTIVGVCLLVALVTRWLRPWLLLRHKALAADQQAGGWQLFMLFVSCWVFCLIASATSLMIYLVTHDQVMMIVSWCATFVVTGSLVPRWGGIYQRALDASSGGGDTPEEPVEHSF